MRVFRGGGASSWVKRREVRMKEVDLEVGWRRRREAHGRRAGVCHSGRQLMTLEMRAGAVGELVFGELKSGDRSWSCSISESNCHHRALDPLSSWTPRNGHSKARELKRHDITNLGCCEAQEHYQLKQNNPCSQSTIRH